MKILMNMILALVLGSSAVYAQGGPFGRAPGGLQGQGPVGPSPGANAPGPGRGAIGPGPGAVERASPGRAARPEGMGPRVRAYRDPGNGAVREGPRGRSFEPKERAARSRDANDGDGPARRAAERAREEKRDSAKAAERAADSKRESQAEAEKAERAKRNEGERNRAADDADRAKRDKDGAEDAQKRAAEGKRVPDADAKRVHLAGERRDRVRSAFRDRHDDGREIRHRRHVGFDIGIGRRLPRDWDFLPVPIAVIDLVPEYRDYVFVYVDDEYVICDPDTYEVVGIVPVDGGDYADAGGPSGHCPPDLALDREERSLILHATRDDREVGVADLRIGWSVPDEIALLEFPDRVLAEERELGFCRYFVAEDQIAIVDPEEEKVVFLIERG